ncbi:hypothetical protein SDC9_04143 [bioreactor metagenome]|uniref:Prophage minor tail protein Z (GPZ) n=1 Tax=bioreactor metagenome TaxID=1076179 RepID=A0A644SV98_9ZZZZ|nr:phage tail protein [Negativicutes bacterium]
MIEITENKMKLAQQLLGHIPGALPKALSNAINRAAEGARTDIVRQVREEYVITAGRVRETIDIRRANKMDLSASIVARGRPRALSYFKLRPGRVTKKRPSEGVHAQVKRSGGGVIPKTFIAKLASGHVGVFRREGNKRFPITQHYGPSVAQMVGNPSVSRYVEAGAIRRVNDRLDHEINRILRGVGK